MNYLTREQWGATFDVSNIRRITLPVALLFVHHDVIAPTDNHSYDMEKAEQTDIARFGKPSYDWAIHPSGVVLEGMTDHLSPDTYGHNSDSLSIMFMGNFENDTPTDEAMFAGRELVHWLRTGGWVDQFVIKGHRDVYATACPGANLYPRIGELIVPPPLPGPVPIPIPVTKEDDMFVLQHKGDYLLCGGKITPLENDLPASVIRIACSDRQWKFFTDTYGQPVT